MMPDTDLLYLRNDEREILARAQDGMSHSPTVMIRIINTLLEARKEIARLQIASGEVIQRGEH